VTERAIALSGALHKLVRCENLFSAALAAASRTKSGMQMAKKKPRGRGDRAAKLGEYCRSETDERGYRLFVLHICG
jgi:hypothetical protein